MAHLAIYRKYRPNNFEEVSGQKTVVNILKNAIISNNVSHAYLFTGPRGTGKTSIAKIFARTINCECLENGNPCNKCLACNNSMSKECVDIIEIDAASNNGVDEIRELKSKINIVPSNLKYKIYIIDEVHMLSIGAFNALLKTLEEPPSHVIFILATTEIQKVPSTILSRCQTLEFKRISPLDMKNRIKHICEKESIKIDEGAIDEIIGVSEGCMRDALSFLEKISSFCEKTIRDEDVRMVIGKPSKQFIKQTIEYFINEDVTNSILKINDAYQQDYDMLYIVEDIINELEKMIFKEKISDNRYQRILSKMIEIYDKIKKSSVNSKIIFEIEILDYCNQNNKIISREIISSDDPVNEDVVKTEVKKEKFEESNVFDHDEFKKIRINNTFVNANKESLNIIKKKWEELHKYAFDKEVGAIICNLLDGIPVAASKEYLILSYQYQTETTKINEFYKKYEEILNKYLTLECNIVAISNDEWKKSKQEYVNTINSKSRYKLLFDIFLNQETNKNINEIKNKDSDENTNNIDNKIFELFNSEDIEVK